MDTLGLLIDFGSTFTKVTAVDLAAGRILARAQAPSTAATDVSEGFFRALEVLAERQPGLFAETPRSLDALDGIFVRASSSAAGGLRIAVVGLVPGLTREAANTAALGAGGKIVGAFAFKLAAEDIAEIERQTPDMVLLTGGTDGGDTRTILHNAQALARSRLTIPFVIAGNIRATEEICKLLSAAGKIAVGVANVMPTSGKLNVEPARDEIRRLFMQRIIQGKGIDKFQSRLPILLPTPMAVLNGALLGAQGHGAHKGCGDLVMVDIGGATTDVHSIGDGKSSERNIIPTGLPEPFAKRSVEGDLGIRCNAATILRRIGAAELYARFRATFPEIAIAQGQLVDYVALISEDAGAVPREAWQSAADAVLAGVAADLAIERHVGRREPYYASGGSVLVQAGKDLTEAPTLIGTGGIFAHNPYADRVMRGSGNGALNVLRPRRPRVVLDRDYVLYAVGLLADSHPEAALKIFAQHLPADHSHDGAHQHALDGAGDGHEDSCCH
ncbi:MAG TPA: methylaspartate mutase accessory protein GlmL [Xanthobacteraceae bacterium]|jgi:uncharacterized protein (TIGR01319 family)|nr:methylaspartate mutase accessory protein GlmL [Xanthobacteraceae bacterium]